MVANITHITLREWMEGRTPLAPDTFLGVAKNLAARVGELHRNRMLHLDLRPEKIGMAFRGDEAAPPDSGFGVTLVSEDYPRPDGLAVSEAGWPYCSPENTGRMLRSADERSDLYSLGVIFYELLTGRLPFVADNPLEWVYMHLAQSPPPMNGAGRSWPDGLEAIVMKLLEKNPDKRYPGVGYLLADLDRVGHARETFFAWQRFNGRERELASLSQAFHSACLGSTEIVYVSGEAGIGKSSLIDELFRRQRQTRDCHWIAGKFEQLSQESPYHPIIQAFRGFVRHLLGERKDRTEHWRDKLRGALGSNARVLAEIVPEIGLLLGETPSVEELPASESKKRFIYVFRKFVQTLAAKEHPLVLFVDDLQWANASSLELIQALLSDPECQYLMFVGAYRHTETDRSKLPGYEPDGSVTDQAVVRHVHLAPLGLAHMNEIVSETLNNTADEAYALTELLDHASNGNPFHLKQILLRLQDDRVLQYSQEQRRWTWNAGRILEQIPSYAVHDLMERKLRRLPQSARELLQTAACVGSVFSPRLIAAVARREDEPADEWAILEAEGLIVRPETNAYRFVHDHIQKLIYGGIDEAAKQELHLRIGSCMNGSAFGDDAFERVNHLNRGSPRIADEGARLALARANLDAGTRAQASSAYDVALGYFAKGAELLSPDDWDKTFELAFELLCRKAECDYLCGRYADSESGIDMLLARARNPVERSRAQTIRIMQFINQGKYLEGTALGLECLREQRVWISPKPGKFALMMEGLRTEAMLRSRFDKLAGLPEMSDAGRIAAMNLIFAIVPSTFFTDKNVFFLLVCRAIQLSLRYGNTPVSAAMYSAFGMMMGTALGKPDKGYALGKVGVELAERSGISSILSRAYTMFGAVLSQFAGNAREVDDYLSRALKLGMDSGDYVFASYAMGGHVNSLYARATLSEVARAIADYMDVLETTKDEFVRQNFYLYRQVILALRGKTDAPDSFGGEGFDEEVFLGRIRKEETAATTMYQYGTYKTQLCYLLGRYEDAVRWAAQAEPFAAYATHLPHWPECVFYETLAALAAHPLSKRPEKKWLARISRFRQWADWNPTAYRARHDLLRAEYRRASGEDEAAEELYDKAIREAREQGDVHAAAIAGELAARHYRRHGKSRTALHYLRMAIESYRNWEVDIKAEQLERLLSRWLAEETGDDHAERTLTASVQSAREQTAAAAESRAEPPGADSLDLEAILKTAQAMSNRLDLDTVLSEIMSTLMKYAGAGKGALVTAIADDLHVRVYSESDGSAEDGPASGLLNDGSLLPEGIIRYVFRTQEEVYYNDGDESWLIHNPYIATRRPQSALCVPVTVHGTMLGVLYLENKLAGGVFAKDRTAVLLAMASHAIFMCVLQQSSEPSSPEPDAEGEALAAAQIEEPLTDRELEVLALLAAGLSNKEIADRLIISAGTVKVHVKNIFAKLKVNRRTKAVAQAKQLKLLSERPVG